MATFKCDIKKQFGKFSGHVWKATEKPQAPVCTDQPTAAAAVDEVLAGISKAGFGEGDEVIFRDSAFTSLSELKSVLLRSPY